MQMNKAFALSLVSKVRRFGTQKWPIHWLVLKMNERLPHPPTPANFEYCNFWGQVNERLKLTV